MVNAIQHSSVGSEILVTVCLNQSGDTRAELQVQDFGSGISPESIPHVFERFFREDHSRSRETGGAGLGLAICKSIVENANGTIEIQKRQRRGNDGYGFVSVGLMPCSFHGLVERARLLALLANP